MGHGYLAGICLDVIEQLFQGVVLGILADYQYLRVTNLRGDNGKVLIIQVTDVHGAVGTQGLCAD